MKTMVGCMQCQVEFGVPRFSTTEIAHIPDDGLIKQTCDLGHKTVAVIQNEKYELLAEMAIEAIAHEHYREAIGSFAAALERLQEYCVLVICRRRGIDAELLERAYKLLSTASERQLGAFAIAYLLEASAVPPVLPQRYVELRNQVVHKGRIASNADAMEFGQAVADCAYPILKLLGSEGFSQTIIDMTFELLRRRGTAAREAGYLASTLSLSCAFRPNQDPTALSIEQLVKEFAKRPDLARSAKLSRAHGRQIDPFPPT